MDAYAESDRAGKEMAARLVSSQNIRGGDEIDTDLLREMAKDALSYVSSFTWCEEVLDSYFGGGFGGIFAIFFLHIRPSRPEVDSWIWIMLGDVPPAYLPFTDCTSPSEAFRLYLTGMSNWVEMAREGRTGTPDEGVPPVNVPATPEWAERLNQKLYGLTLTVKHLFDEPTEAEESRPQ